MTLQKGFSEIPTIITYKCGYCVDWQPVLKGWQKPQGLVTQIMKRHMTVPEGFILDGMCGTATATVCALKLGMNAVGFDSDIDHCHAALYRLAKMPDNIMGPVEETMTTADWTKL